MEEIRVWTDGCFDSFHFGHANLLRQAKMLGSRLIVGVHSDEEIKSHKGGPVVLSQEERCKLISGIKWVDEVVSNAPYVTSLETLDQHFCDFCAHGNDITVSSDGSDCYKEVKESGRYREVKRTQGVSTTDLVKRILRIDGEQNLDGAKSPWTGDSPFLLTVERLMDFRGSEKRIPEPGSGSRVIYVDGAFDLFHVGHLDFLERARQRGDYLIVGLHSDEAIRAKLGEGRPIMNLQERTLNVLAYKPVDDVLIGAPSIVSEDLIRHLNVHLVICGAMSDDKEYSRYAIPKKLDKFDTLEVRDTTSTDDIIRRIEGQKDAFMAKIFKKEKNEAAIFAKLSAK